MTKIVPGVVAVFAVLFVAKDCCNGQLFEPFDQCLVLGCCEEDCCADDTFWEPDVGRCFAYSGYPGFNGIYSNDYVFGCAERLCCDEGCCADGTVYDVSIQCCVPIDTQSPAPNVTLSPTAAPTQCGNCRRFWNGDKEMNIDFGSDDIIEGLEDAMDSAISVLQNAIDEVSDLKKLLEEAPERLLGIIRDAVTEGIIGDDGGLRGRIAGWLRQIPRPEVPDVIKEGIESLQGKLKPHLDALKMKLEMLKTEIIMKLKEKYKETLDEILPNQAYGFEGAASQCDKVLSGPQVIAKTQSFKLNLNFDIDIEDIGFTVEGSLDCKINLDGSPAAGFNVPGGPTQVDTTCEDPGPKTVAERKVIEVEGRLLLKVLVVTATLGGTARDIVGDIYISIKPTED